MKMITRFWRDEAGSVGSAEVMFLMTLLAIGMIVGIKSLRDAAVTEFADYGQALSNLDQSYSFVNGANMVVSNFEDGHDFCDEQDDVDVGSPGSKCVNVCVNASMESP